MTSDLPSAVGRVAPFVARDKKAPDALRRVLVEPTRVAATDRHRLVVVEGTFDVTTRTLVDADTLAEVDGVADFPDIERLLAAPETGTSVTIDATTLLDAIEGATGADDEPLAVQLEAGRVLLGPEATDATTHVNATYLHDAVEAAGTGDVVLEITGETTPLAVRGASVLTLLMPVRVRAGR
jgi:DNA polymerase III sliding clamp (beta) subunit (PCNA family)